MSIKYHYNVSNTINAFLADVFYCFACKKYCNVFIYPSLNNIYKW